jgi:general secretion pathway protein G
MKRHKGVAGFTIVEILVVIAIISTLAGLLMSGVMIARTKVRKDQTKISLANIGMALKNYRTDMGDYPPGSGDITSSETLYKELTTAKGFGPYLPGLDSKDIKDTDKNGSPELVDPWGNPIWYTRGDNLTNDKDFELRSAGPDGIYGTDDDIVL